MWFTIPIGATPEHTHASTYFINKENSKPASCPKNNAHTSLKDVYEVKINRPLEM